MENINNDVPQHQPYRNEKVFNSGKTALELNFSETNGSVNLILAGPLVSKPGSFDWTGQKSFSTKLSDAACLRLGLFLLSVILARNPGVPSDAVLTCMRLNANAQLQK